MMNKYGRLAVACLAGSYSVITHADINLNGFATLAGGMTMSDDQSLHGYDDIPSFEQNSLLGLQVDSDLGEGLTATAQIIARGSESWEPKFEWAYVGYQANDHLKFLFGRQRIPYYQYSDYLDVSFAYHWITPPEGVYNLPFDSTNGVGAIITNELGPFDSTLHLLYGRNQEDLQVSGESVAADFQHQASVAWSLNWNWLTLRLGYSQSDLQIDVPAIENLAAAWGLAGFPEFTPRISAADDDNSGSFTDVGITIDRDNLLIIAEYTDLSVDGTALVNTGEAYFASFGYRFGNIMPHITYGAGEDTPGDYTYLDMVPDGLDPGLDALKAGTVALYEGSRGENEYYIFGVRWDFHSSAAFKVEYKSEKDKLMDETNNLLRFAIATVF